MHTYRKFALDLARRAGKAIKENYTLGMNNQWKEDGTPVTATDLMINNMVIEAVNRNFPEHSVLSEEESDMKAGSEYIWVCDPVDGTIPFTFGVPVFSFSLALVKDGQPILGVVYDPMMDRLYSASQGEGTFLNGQRIMVSTADNLRKAVMNVDGAGQELPGYDLFRISSALQNQMGGMVFRMYSYIYSGMLVAAGEFAAAIFLKDTVHDAAAVKIIVEEAGGRATDIEGRDQRYDRKCKGLIASNGKLHDELVDILNDKKYR